MLRLTRRSEYGIIAMTHLAQHRDDAVSSRDIAERYIIPKRLLAEVMKDLVHRGLVRSVRGASGGYRLAADPMKTTVLNVLQALEGPFEMVPCTTSSVPMESMKNGSVHNGNKPATPPASACELLLSCPIKGPIHKIHEQINSVLATVTLDDLSRGEVGGVDTHAFRNARPNRDSESNTSISE
ncbi:MAG: Rrf2 family transcriptional regulator [Planctomycetes bacterium]|nr:Rrf2 family transcriptional regulator [Planctomycetota bacterium]